MPPYSKGFNFDQGSLGRNLATLDTRMRDLVSRDLDAHTVKAELTMKEKAPWHDNTGAAREGLWADNQKHDDHFSITLGHTAEYGVYLEKRWGGKFQIIAPVLLDTARSFMRSLEHAFAQLETHTSPAVQITAPGVGTRPGTSQGGTERAQRSRSRAEHAARQAVSVGRRIFGGISKRTKRTRRG